MDGFSFCDSAGSRVEDELTAIELLNILKLRKRVLQ